MRKRHGALDGGVTPRRLPAGEPGSAWCPRHPCCGLIKGEELGKEAFSFGRLKACKVMKSWTSPVSASCPPAFPRPLVPPKASLWPAVQGYGLTQQRCSRHPFAALRGSHRVLSNASARSHSFLRVSWGQVEKWGRQGGGRQGHPLVYQWLVRAYLTLPVTLPGSGPGQHPWGASPCGLML